jgi:hypothetical protein
MDFFSISADILKEVVVIVGRSTLLENCKFIVEYSH